MPIYGPRPSEPVVVRSSVARYLNLKRANATSWPERGTASTPVSQRSSRRRADGRSPRQSLMPVRRGDIYWVEFDPVKGSEQGGLRPALVIQRDVGNRYSPTTVVAAITRTLPPRPYPFVVVLDPSDSGLPERSA